MGLVDPSMRPVVLRGSQAGFDPVQIQGWARDQVASVRQAQQPLADARTAAVGPQGVHHLVLTRRRFPAADEVARFHGAIVADTRWSGTPALIRRPA